MLKADTEGTLIFGNGADNTVNIANVGTIDINNTIADTTTKVEITDNVIINDLGGGQLNSPAPTGAKAMRLSATEPTLQFRSLSTAVN